MRLDHVAHLCRDARATHHFYTHVLGLELTQAYAGDELLLVYTLPGGGSLAFSASDKAAPPAVTAAAWERQHVGVTVQNRAEFERWLKRLSESGISHQLIEDERIYFADPNGLIIEIEVEAAAAPNPRAPEVLERWLNQRPQ